MALTLNKNKLFLILNLTKNGDIVILMVRRKNIYTVYVWGEETLPIKCFKNAITMMEKKEDEQLFQTEDQRDIIAKHNMWSWTGFCTKGGEPLFFFFLNCYWDNWRNVKGSVDGNVVLCQYGFLICICILWLGECPYLKKKNTHRSI